MNPQAWVGGERGLRMPETRPLACLGQEGRAGGEGPGGADSEEVPGLLHRWAPAGIGAIGASSLPIRVRNERR
jgi:hypothetical protein